MPGFFKKTIFFISPILVMVVIINLINDPAHIFTKNYRYEKRLAEILNSGLNATGVNNMDERVFQKYFIAGLPKKPGNIVLGSSNSMLFESEIFPDNYFINNSVSSASLKDFAAIIDIYEKEKKMPQKVIMSLCPEMFNDKFELSGWKSYKDNYYSLVNKLNIAEKPVNSDKLFTTEIDKYKQLISLSYFQSAIKAFNSKKIETSLKKHNPKRTKAVDGSFNPGDYYKQYSLTEIENSVKEACKLPIPDFEGFNFISQSNFELLEKLVDYLQNKKIEVIFYILVYHPIYFECVQKNYPLVGETEIALRKMALKKNIQFHGALDPYETKMPVEEFFDQNHVYKPGLILNYNFIKDENSRFK